MSVTHLVPKANPIIEQVIANPFGLYEMIRWLKEKGVTWTEPETPLTAEELRTMVRVIWREMKMRENLRQSSGEQSDE